MIQGDVYFYSHKEPGRYRPCLILTSSSKIADLNAVTIASIVTEARESEITLSINENDGMSGDFLINLSSIHTIPKEKIGDYIAHLSDKKMEEVFEAIKFAFGFDK
jgi:mRNA interferase MazF